MVTKFGWGPLAQSAGSRLGLCCPFFGPHVHSAGTIGVYADEKEQGATIFFFFEFISFFFFLTEEIQFFFFEFSFFGFFKDCSAP